MVYEFELVEASDVQTEILYDLLGQRIHTISHSEIQNYEIHRKFVKSHPYRKWYLVKIEAEYVGSIYVKNDNSIGLNLNYINKVIVQSCIDFVRQNLIPMRPTASMVPEYFYINVAATNNDLIKTMSELFVPQIQISFKI